MERSARSLKSFANRLARLATSGDGLELTRMLRTAGFMDEWSKAPEAMPVEQQPAQTGRVGIWESKTENGKTSFVRNLEKMKEWHLWADVATIPPKQNRRVVLIGESAARGFLYDPLFTPAMALQGILDSCLGRGGCEVVDLARTNLGLEIKELALASLSLQPDAVVVFAGNNWRFSFSNREDLRWMDALVREQGVAALKRFIEEDLDARARTLVKEVSSAFESAKVPLIWIIPEFNLADWREPVTNAPHLLPAHANQEWMELREAAEIALSQSRYLEAAKCAARMVELDEGTSVAGLYLLAECNRQENNHQAARHCLQAARDAIIWDLSRAVSPRAYSITQKALREEAASRGQRTVDLPASFAAYLDGEIPGRRLFLDYCHLTAEGIKVAMSLAAGKVMEVFTDAEPPLVDLLKACPEPGAKIKAEGAFLAAVHNAHWHQSYDVVQHYCLQALRSAPAIARVMTQFLDVQARRTPMLMIKPGEQIAQSDSPLIQRYLLNYSQQQLDLVLSSAIAASLKKLGVDVEQEVLETRLAESVAGPRDINLLDYYYCSSGRQPQEAMWVTPRSGLQPRLSQYYKAYWHASQFVFIAGENQSLYLSLTCRIPGVLTEEKAVSIEVNGEVQGLAGVGNGWRTFEIPLDRKAVRRGVNAVVLHWPAPVFDGRKALAAAADGLLEEVPPDFYPVFGEVHSFRVCLVRKAETGVDSHQVLAGLARAQ